MPYKITALQPFGVIVEPKHAPIHVNELDIDELRELFCVNNLCYCVVLKPLNIRSSLRTTANAGEK